MARLLPTNNRMAQSTRNIVCDVLNQLLADTADLAAQTKFAHWNVTDERFFLLHTLFDDLFAPLPGFADDIAERITALGGVALGTLRMAATASNLPEVPAETQAGDAFLDHLILLYATHGEHLRTAINLCCDMDESDEVTSNMLQEQSHQIDKSLYFLERHVIGGDEDDLTIS